MLGILTRSGQSMAYAKQGLEIWAYSMIPALLPFMILSGIIVRMDLVENVTGFLAIPLRKLLHCSKVACYCILVGFLCGFPMGAKTIAELYAKGNLDKQESRILLAFCNNLGPAYLAGLVIPLLHIKYPLYCFSIFYGIPFIYGFGYYHLAALNSTYAKKNTNTNNNMGANAKRHGFKEFLFCLETSIVGSMSSIILLGGYVIFFCLLNLLPYCVTGKAQSILAPFFEITSGLQSLEGRMPIYCLTMCSFGGLCCLAQTHAALKDTDLNDYLGEYAFHKSMQALLTFLAFLFMTMLVPNLFAA